MADATVPETPGGEPKLPDIQPAQPTRPAAVEQKGGPPTSRPFPCCFAQYNCNASFTSKNEWKRHISTKHIQLGFWRCDMCNPSPGLDHPVFNDFNRKDLFTQHLRRMHAPNAPSAPGTPNPANPTIVMEPPPTEAGSPTASSTAGLGTLSDDQILDIQKRCFRILRQPPQVSSCVFCSRVFSGPNSWEERLEHVGGHMERDRKNGTNCLDITSWKEDDELRQYLVREGIVEQDQRGNWRIGDGRPRRPLDIQMPSTPGTAAPPRSSSQTPATGAAEQESDTTTGRRRGRPPKRAFEGEYPSPLGPGTALQAALQAGMQDARPRPEQLSVQQSPSHTPGQAGPSPHPTSEMRGPSLKPRVDSAPTTPVTSVPLGQHSRLEPYPPQQHQSYTQGHAPQTQYARESSPSSQRPQLLPNIMPRTPQTALNQASHSNPFSGSSQGLAPIAIAPAYHQHGMAPLAPAPSQNLPLGMMMGPHGPVNISQALQQQMIAAAAIGPMTSPPAGPPALAPAPPRANQSPLGGLPQSPFGYQPQSQSQSQSHSQGPPPLAPAPVQSFPHSQAPPQEPAPTSPAPAPISTLAAPSLQQQSSKDGPQELPPSTGATPLSENGGDTQNRARTFHEVIFEGSGHHQARD
jgi:hypothetical protein